ncbi:MAG: hypothetical protein AAGM46_26860, partial [Cyanobacteria bacterium J06582_2]
HSLYRGKVPSGRWRGCAVRRKAQGNARDWGLGESSPSMDLVFRVNFCRAEKDIVPFIEFILDVGYKNSTQNS